MSSFDLGHANCKKEISKFQFIKYWTMDKFINSALRNLERRDFNFQLIIGTQFLIFNRHETRNKMVVMAIPCNGKLVMKYTM